jgi:multidrug transporter EmrE-like cation transporter
MHIALFLLSVMLAAVSQVMLKKAADRGLAGIRQYLNPLTVCAYGLFFGCTLLTLWAYRVVPLSLGMALESAGYVFVTALSAAFLHEPVTRRKALGIALIVAGVVGFALAG